MNPLVAFDLWLTERLSDFKEKGINSRGVLWKRTDRLLWDMGIKPLPVILECTLLECVMTRGKYPKGLKAFVNEIKEGQQDYENFDNEVYEVVQQWRTDQNFTLSVIIWYLRGDGEFTLPFDWDTFKPGMKIRITNYRNLVVWHLFHRLGLMFNSLLFSKVTKALDVGSSVEVYPREWEKI